MAASTPDTRGPGRPSEGIRKTLILPVEHWDALNAIARVQGQPRNAILRMLVASYLDSKSEGPSEGRETTPTHIGAGTWMSLINSARRCEPVTLDHAEAKAILEDIRALRGWD